MLIYGICYYYGKNKKQNIINHIKCFNNVKKDNDIFCLTIMVDNNNTDLHNKIEIEFIELLEANCVLTHKILIDFNSCGTVLGLYNTFNYFKNNNKNDYIAFFEEDFYSINNNWLYDSINKLNNSDYIYIGENTQDIHSKITNDNLYLKEINVYDMNKSNCWKLNFSDIYHKNNCELLNNTLYWTDGGYYFSSIGNFNKIYEKIGIFHKGNKEIKYHHKIDGIILGEVGFPSQIKKYFNFAGLLRGKYFVHKEK
jgi:hypothetical protein